jgi:hypothetical protein
MEMRLIDADALIEFIDLGHYRNPLELCYSEQYVVDMIESRPTADVVERKRGKWMYLYEDNYKCSICGSWWCCTDSQIDEMNYCPNCGAEMERKR